MSISSEDLTIAKEASNRIKRYERQRPKRLIAYLFPVIWLISFIVRYEAKTSFWNLFQIAFWSLALIGVIIFEYKRRQTYLHDLATLERLQKLHGVALSFTESNTAIEVDEKGADAIKEKKGTGTFSWLCGEKRLEKVMPRLGRRHLQRGCFHVLNRGNHRQTLFHGPDDYAQFLDLLAGAQKRFKVGLWGYCLMSNHWHLVVEVDNMDELSGWVHWICNRHVRLFHRDRRELGGGHIYQGRFKSFPIEDEVYLYQVLRYVEANPVRARLVERGRDWPWSSLSRVAIQRELLPVERPRLQPWLRNAAWEAQVDQSMQASSLAGLRQSVVRGTPFGAPDWVSRLVAEQGLETTVRPPGRPRKLVSAS